MLKNYSKIEVDQYGNKIYLNVEGDYHRLDGPAFEHINRSKYWLINEKEHRNIDPSVEYSTGEKSWYFKTLARRVGGPYRSDEELWFIHGNHYTKRKYFNKVWMI